MANKSSPHHPIPIFIGGFVLKIKTIHLLLLLIFSSLLVAQKPKATLMDKDGNPIEGVTVEVKEMEEVGRQFVPDVPPEFLADLSKPNLVDQDGNRALLESGRVTIIEYWSRSSVPENLFWNKMRELEHRFDGSDDVQFISINYDYVMNGKHQIAAAQEFLKNWSEPKHLLFDKDDGFRDFFHVNGPVAYLLIDHVKKYRFVGRGDDPKTIEIFEKHLPEAIRFKKSVEGQLQVP